MSKAAKPVRRASPTRTVRAPFALNADGRKALALHRAYRAADAAWYAALKAERAGMSECDWEKHKLSPRTDALSKAAGTASIEATRFAEALAERTRARVEGGERLSLADVLAVSIAGYHANPAERAAAEALRHVSGLGSDLEGDSTQSNQLRKQGRK